MAAGQKLQGERHGEVIPLRAAHGRHLIALTRDPLLAQALQDLADGDVTVHLVEDLRRLADELMQHGTAVALLDAQALSVPVDAAVDAVKNQFPDVRLMVAGHAGEQTVLATRISQQKVFRFVHKPASPQRLKLFLEAASSQQGLHASTGATAEMPILRNAPPPPGGGRSTLLIAAGVAAAAVLAAGGWWMLRGNDAAESTPVLSPRRAAAPELAAVLARADAALASGRLVAADGTSAAELYREAQRLDARNAAAVAGFERAIEGALASAEQSLLAGELEQARVSAEMVRLIEPANSRLGFLNTQIERELARLQADTTQREAFETRQAQIRSAVAAVNEHIVQGALIEPADDNAVSAFRQAQQLGAGDPQVRASRDALVGALLTAADREHGGGRAAVARQLVDAAGSVNSSAPGLDIMRRRVAESTASAPAAAPASAPPAENVSVAAAAPASPPAIARTDSASSSSTAPAVISAPTVVNTPPPAAVEAPAAEKASASIVSANSLKTLRRADPVYPTSALQQLTSGWVDLEFTVRTDGTVGDVEVTQSQPRRTFDAAAMAAIRRYRFEPVMQGGVAVEQRARLRMRFAAQ